MPNENKPEDEEEVSVYPYLYRMHEYRKQHPVAMSEEAAMWHDKRWERYRMLHPLAGDQTRGRAQRYGSTVGALKAIRAVYRRARETVKVNCYLCGKRIPLGQRHVDHIVPLSKGGEHSARNLAITCAGCNERKGAKMPHEVGILI